MRELHEGIYGLHTGGHSLSTKVVRAGYYWPTLRADTFDFTRRVELETIEEVQEMARIREEVAKLRAAMR
ncbi:hypothetical protein JHK87_016096 [Glycine soja]|nr:hypothetical protein JHK87_016096 [Glycine soja]